MMRLLAWWRKKRHQRMERQDIEEYSVLDPHTDSSAWYAKFREWKRKKYNLCAGCHCPELYHKDGLLRSGCEICDCRSFIPRHENCKCLPPSAAAEPRR